MKRYREKEHKRLVKLMRKLNKTWGEDAFLGLNRFRADFFSERCYNFEDSSGCELTITIKMTDNLTGNCAYFITNNYAFIRDLSTYMNDFMIRCSSGYYGHIPALDYIACKIDTIIPYVGEGGRRTKFGDEGVRTFNWTKYNLF